MGTLSAWMLLRNMSARGGLKLEHALDRYGLLIAGLRAIDFGASTGGFTDCLLQRGAAKVYAVDVGTAQLAWKLRNDPRVVVMEKQNARHLVAASFPQPFEKVDLVVIDCSFISLKHLLLPAMGLLKDGGWMVPLIKPQFEAGKAEVDRGEGVITDPLIHLRVVAELKEFVSAQPGLLWRDCIESPLLGPAGNKEFLAWIEKNKFN